MSAISVALVSLITVAVGSPMLQDNACAAAASEVAEMNAEQGQTAFSFCSEMTMDLPSDAWKEVFHVCGITAGVGGSSSGTGCALTPEEFEEKMQNLQDWTSSYDQLLGTAIQLQLHGGLGPQNVFSGSQTTGMYLAKLSSQITQFIMKGVKAGLMTTVHRLAFDMDILERATDGHVGGNLIDTVLSGYTPL